MRKISFWASRNIWSTRFIIIGIYVLLNCTGIILGDLLFSVNIIMEPVFLYCTCFIFLAGMFLYPSKNEKSTYRNFYRSQKIADLVLAGCTFLMIMYGGNHLNTIEPEGGSNLYAASFISVSKNNSSSVTSEINPNGKDASIKPVKKPLSKKELKTKLKNNLRQLRKLYKESSGGEKALLIALSVIVALGLLFLLLSLSCSISCSGSDGLAVLVGVLGTTLIIFLLVRVIQRITRGPRKTRTPKPQSTGT